MYQALEVIGLPALHDNYIWAIHDHTFNQCVVVDPGEARPVLSYLKQHKTKLSAILTTHYHTDHISGIPELKETFPEVSIYGSALESVPYQITALREGHTLSLLKNTLFFTTYEVPGHTLGHIAYYTSKLNGVPAIFTGDTLFSGGCGRLLEGTPEQLYQSLGKLKNLPHTTRIYCGHEYTLSNLQFAQWLEPNNRSIQSALESTKASLANGTPTLPSHLEIEEVINPFLRCEEKSFLKIMETRLASNQFKTPLVLFTQLRKLKDSWKSTELI